jgi:hypothetical protein
MAEALSAPGAAAGVAMAAGLAGDGLGAGAGLGPPQAASATVDAPSAIQSRDMGFLLYRRIKARAVAAFR